MKKSIYSALAVFTMLFGAQFTTSAQVEEGSFLIDPYIGAPTINIWWENVVDLTGSENIRTIGGPLGYGGRMSYMVADNFGIGLDVNFVKSGYEYENICEGCGSQYDTVTMSYNDIVSTYRFESNVLRVMLRMDYHFVQTENLDVYFGAAAGYKYAKRVGYIDGQEDASVGITGAFIPVAIRAAIGMRYYFIPNLGLHLELGGGGGQIIEGGISVKI